MHSIIALSRNCSSMSIVQRDIKRLTTYIKDFISREYRSNLLSSTRLSFITSENILMTFSFRRRATCKGASILHSISKLSEGGYKFHRRLLMPLILNIISCRLNILIPSLLMCKLILYK